MNIVLLCDDLLCKAIQPVSISTNYKIVHYLKDITKDKYTTPNNSKNS